MERLLKEKKAKGQAPRNAGMVSGPAVYGTLGVLSAWSACRGIEWLVDPTPHPTPPHHTPHTHTYAHPTSCVRMPPRLESTLRQFPLPPPTLLHPPLAYCVPAALEKARLENELSHAREHGDEERVAE